MLPPLIPPFRYAIVEDEVYRGAYPKKRNYRFLKRLKLKTMLSLTPDPPVPELLEFCQSQNIRNIRLEVSKVKDNVPLSYSRAIQSVQIIIDPSNLPIFIHCLDGANVTGLVVTCLRKLQMWSVPSCMSEFLRYLRGGVISSEESEFIEKFTGEIEIPCTIPHWLWGGRVTSNKHPRLKLKFLDPRVVEQSEQKKDGKNIEVDNKDDYRERVNGEKEVVSRTIQALSLEGLDDINDLNVEKF
ncbi:protein-tyrosine phosphatase [Gigaspora margarita]|uniref:Protein-tyrosine phosphatase n=1 Tax=Gigaspora margarita TaxID=4874 RepID=A0A8H4ADJ4_GIGMA|nr:protein-tyrosine phosphatase [Gigaspora margarita]